MKWPNGKLVVVDMEQSTPVGYINVYEQNDIWIKVTGCEFCKMPPPQRCCGNCPFAMERGCAWHFESGNVVSSKPLNCIALPEIVGKRTEKCTLVYKCVFGSMKGKYRRVCDHSDIFLDELP